MKTLHMDSWPPIDTVRLDQAHGLWTRSAWRLGSRCQFLILSHIVSMLNLCCEKYRKSNPMEKADHIGRTPFVYTYCVAFRSWRRGYSTAIQVSKRRHLTMGKGVVVNRTGIRLWVHDAHIKTHIKKWAGDAARCEAEKGMRTEGKASLGNLFAIFDLYLI